MFAVIYTDFVTEKSLRERSKERRYRAILLAGMRLFAEQGYEATTVAQIAAEAEVATRSVSAYFPSKLHIATASSVAAGERLIAALNARDTGSSVVDRIVDWLREEPTFVPEEEWRLRAVMLQKNPALQGVGTEDPDRLLSAAAQAAAADLGLEQGHPGVQVAIGVVSGIVVRLELLMELDREDVTTLRLVRDALTGAFEGIRRGTRISR